MPSTAPSLHPAPAPGHHATLLWTASWVHRTSFLVFVTCFALGRSFQEIFSLTGAIGLLIVYALDYRGSNLRRFGPKWIFCLLFGVIVFKTVHTIHPEESWYALKTNLWQSFGLFFLALEFVRSWRDLRIVVGCFALLGFYEGLDGVYQYVTGVDFIRGTAAADLGGRLTGSMETFRVGNLMSLVLPPSLALVAVLPQRWPLASRWTLTLLVLVPGLFLLVGSQTRSAWTGCLAAAVALFFLLQGFSWKKLALLAGGLVLLVLFGPQRVSLDMVLKDGRIQELWPFGIAVFQAFPILGSGINTYVEAVKQVGLEATFHSHILSHPHNVYIQFAAETGLVGLSVFLLFLVSHLAWSLRRIKAGLEHDRPLGAWFVVACLWCSYLGYAVTAFSAHSYFRPWWLAMSMVVLGVLIGACLTPLAQDAHQGEPPTEPGERRA